jgi:ribonuclease HI
MIAYTDGSCQGNPGPGGFGVVVLDDNENEILSYSKRCKTNTTNNREELKAILWAFFNLGVKDKSSHLTVYSDSAYCVNTLTNWMFNWERNGWLKSDNKEPENLDLIKPFFEFLQKGYQIELKKVKGHANNKWNEKADLLATGKINS